jgi:hypothetical protein
MTSSLWNSANCVNLGLLGRLLLCHVGQISSDAKKKIRQEMFLPGHFDAFLEAGYHAMRY